MPYCIARDCTYHVTQVQVQSKIFNCALAHVLIENSPGTNITENAFFSFHRHAIHFVGKKYNFQKDFALKKLLDNKSTGFASKNV